MCFCTTASYTEHLRYSFCVVWLTQFVFCFFFISAFCQNAVYSTRLWQQQPHSKDVIGATMCLLNKKYALSAHYVKPWSKKKKKKKRTNKDQWVRASEMFLWFRRADVS